jgi:hypothetical protein
MSQQLNAKAESFRAMHKPNPILVLNGVELFAALRRSSLRDSSKTKRADHAPLRRGAEAHREMIDSRISEAKNRRAEELI